MKQGICRALFATIMALFGNAALGAYNCTVSSPGVTEFYVPADPQNVSQSSVTVTCSRLVSDGGAIVNFSVAVDNGLSAGGGFNRAVIGGGAANRINYETYRDSGCSSVWGSVVASRITGSLDLTSVTSNNTSLPWWGCIPAGQVGKNAGAFVDTVTMTLRAPPAPDSVGSFPVTITHPASCSVTSPAATMNMVYTSFATSPSNGSTNFGVTCTNSMPYTIALDAYGGTIAGLIYTLILNGGVLNVVGTGAAQVIPVDGAIAAGQAGTCIPSCTGSQTRTLTVTY